MGIARWHRSRCAGRRANDSGATGPIAGDRNGGGDSLAGKTRRRLAMETIRPALDHAFPPLRPRLRLRADRIFPCFKLVARLADELAKASLPGCAPLQHRRDSNHPLAVAM